MNKVIETNISYDDKEKIVDFQSRVIEVSDWDSYVEEIKSGETKFRTACLGSLTGLSLPRKTKIDIFNSDEYHLCLTFINSMTGLKMKKLAYLINE